MKNKSSSKISVIISTYNRSKFLKTAIDSVLSQTYKNIEIIVIDDCSKDDTEEVIRKQYARGDILYIKNGKNLGCGISRKKAMSYATGEYINFLDDDDKFIDNTYFEKAVSILDNDEKIALVCGGHIVNDVVNKTKIEKEFPYHKIVDGKKLFINFASQEYPKPIISVAIIRKQVLEKAQYQDMKILNDTTIFLRTILYGNMAFINKPQAEYLVHGNNISFNCKIDFIIDNLDEKYKVFELAKKNSNYAQIELKKWLENQLDITILYYINGSKPGYFSYKKLIKWYKKNIKDKDKLKEFKKAYHESKKNKKII